MESNEKKDNQCRICKKKLVASSRTGICNSCQKNGKEKLRNMLFLITGVGGLIKFIKNKLI